MEELKQNAMMAHLMQALDEGKDIGHYGRLVFAMIARHFMGREELCSWLEKDRDFSAEKAAALVRQVESRDYNPPKRERILEWQREQEFPICPNAGNPDACNVYKGLKFPDGVYENIEHYQEKKAEVEEGVAS